MLNEWLRWSKRNPCPYSQFDVVDVEQASELSAEVKSYLISLLCAARFDPGFLGAIAEYLGWQEVKDLIVAAQMPTLTTAKRGEFGEVLTGAILEQFHGYRIPVPKLRFKITAGQSLPATDTLALRITGNNLVGEVCFVESKLRTGRDSMTAVRGYKQLQDDYESKLPDILTFVAARLFDLKDPLFEGFASYLRERKDTTDRDTFRLILCWDSLTWREQVLERLEENGVDLPRMTVHAIRINSLYQITDELFDELGVGEVLDDD